MENLGIVRAMKGGSVATACNTHFKSCKSSSNTVKTTRGDSGQASLRVSCEFLFDVNLLGKTQHMDGNEYSAQMTLKKQSAVITI